MTKMFGGKLYSVELEKHKPVVYRNMDGIYTVTVGHKSVTARTHEAARRVLMSFLMDGGLVR